MNELKIYTREQENEMVSKHFRAGEFFCKCGKCNNQLVDLKHICKLEILRETLNKPIKILSGFRCEPHNRNEKGSENSQHCKGLATDIIVEGITPEEVASTADFLNFGGVGSYKTFTHIDSRKGKVRW